MREHCKPEIQQLQFDGIDTARPTQQALASIASADLIVLAPSNPLVSIDPILQIDGIKDAVIAAKAAKIAISPLIAGKVVKGPADRMMAALGLRVDALGVAQYYHGLIDTLFIDHADADHSQAIEALGIRPVCDNILMQTQGDKKRLARAVCNA